MNISMLFESDVDLAHSLPYSDGNPRMGVNAGSWLGTVPRFQGHEQEMERMKTFQNRSVAHDWWAENEPLAELAERVVNELEAECRDLRLVTLDEMKHRMVSARRAQVMAG